MRFAGLPLALSFVGWLTDPTPHDAVQRLRRLQATDIVDWDPLATSVDIWPTGQGVAAADVRIVQDPTSADSSTVLAVVMWNGDFRAAIYRLRVGRDEDAFADAIAGTQATLTVVSSSAGDLGRGKLPGLPHPHI